MPLLTVANIVLQSLNHNTLGITEGVLDILAYCAQVAYASYEGWFGADNLLIENIQEGTIVLALIADFVMGILLYPAIRQAFHARAEARKRRELLARGTWAAYWERGWFESATAADNRRDMEMGNAQTVALECIADSAKENASKIDLIVTVKELVGIPFDLLVIIINLNSGDPSGKTKAFQILCILAMIEPLRLGVVLLGRHRSRADQGLSNSISVPKLSPEAKARVLRWMGRSQAGHSNRIELEQLTPQADSDLTQWCQENHFVDVHTRKKTFQGATKFPLHTAIKQKNEKIVGLLLMSGVDRNAEDSKKQTPTQLAEQLNKNESHDAILAMLR